MAAWQESSCSKLAREIMTLMMELNNIHALHWNPLSTYSERMAPDHPLTNIYPEEIRRIHRSNENRNLNSLLERSLTLQDVMNYASKSLHICWLRGFTVHSFFTYAFELCNLAYVFKINRLHIMTYTMVYVIAQGAFIYLYMEDQRQHSRDPSTRNRNL